MKRDGAQDSVVEGFWKKDAYIGKNEKPWMVHNKTGSVRSVEVTYTPDPLARVKIIITNTTSGQQTTFGVVPSMKVDNVQVLKGHFERQTTLESHLKSSETTLIEVIFPFRIKLNIGREEVEVEFLSRAAIPSTYQLTNSKYITH
jgi:hypothetical protein